MSIYKGTDMLAGVPNISGAINATLEAIYPVGSIYIGTQSTCPLATIISGSTWVKVSEGRVLQGSDSSHNAGTTIAAGLPNITGSMSSPKQLNANYNLSTATGAFSSGGQHGGSNSIIGPSSSNATYQALANFSAQSSNSIYGNSSTVQPPAYVVNIWERTA